MTDLSNLEWLWDVPLTSEDLAWDHAMEISGAIFQRMKDLGMKKKDLAARMGVTPARISHILRGEQSMTLSTLARLETALGINMSEGFSHPTELRSKPSHCAIIPFPGPTERNSDDYREQIEGWTFQVKES